ncbi:putative transcription factor iiib 70 kd subunit [Dioszegia hungarica]|uniref:B-related factor 1 n=1 Tax=Dioszegia hungarica TaxID=4972 RepID=A0AA38HD07_9TREE|nr:putative transcription factor iiib 70 kd subunit [Dioszegia hungarica]KAI9636774.1 putative transcription factor iiib 70 kd subunit [Dioszegia hungarica]
MPAQKSCPTCGSTQLETDYNLGQVACGQCGHVVESGILVSEVGFAEGSGGRTHVAGTFVSNYSRQEKIQHTAREMGLGAGIANGATRSFSLAVDQRFNKGRRTDYLVASCLYLQCRLMGEPYMLIDFSERLQVNVFELAGTYLKLRTNLHLDKSMPEVDPAIYNIHFARRLALGHEAQKVASDASRLVRRFKADWMTQGRRPAGICGACLIIAARMSNYLRTPEEVGQVVKCSAYTIRKRLREFAITEMAQKTVKEWRGLSEKELDEVRTEEPPIVKENRKRKEREERERLEEEEAEREAEENSPRGKGKKKDKGKKRQRFEGSGDVDEEEAIREAAAEAAAQAEEDGEGNDEEVDLEGVIGAFADDIDAAGDNPEAAQEERRIERSAFQRENRALAKAMLDPEVDILDDEDAEALEKHDEDGEGDKEEGDGVPAATQLGELTAEALTLKPETFTEWDDPESTLKHFTEQYFAADPRLVLLDPAHVKERVSKWLTGARDPQEVARECQVVDIAYRRREFLARESRLETLSDLDEDELESYYVLDERDKQLRARVWLSQNGKWLEQSKLKEEERAAYNKANNIDPNKPKIKRKRAPAPGSQKPFKSTRDAIDSFAAQKKFSSRINYASLGKLGGYNADDAGETDLQKMDDEKDDDELAGYAKYGDDKEEEDDDQYW